jgi:hypothetical protein
LAWFSVIPYSKKGNKLFIFILGILTPVLLPIIFTGVTKSWIKANRKIIKGHLIKSFE